MKAISDVEVKKEFPHLYKGPGWEYAAGWLYVSANATTCVWSLFGRPIREAPTKKRKEGIVTPELLKLIEDYGNASYDCGEWQEDPAAEPYDIVVGRQRAAKEALMDQVSELEQSL